MILEDYNLMPIDIQKISFRFELNITTYWQHTIVENFTHSGLNHNFCFFSDHPHWNIKMVINPLLSYAMFKGSHICASVFRALASVSMDSSARVTIIEEKKTNGTCIFHSLFSD